MIRSLAIAVLLFLVATSCALVGVSPERAAQKNILKKRWEKAEIKLRKALRKDTTNALARYLFAVYFFSYDNPDYQLDSAYQYTLQAMTDFQLATQKQRERRRRFAFDSANLVNLRKKIDSAAFEVARASNTEKGYIRFLTNHPLAEQQAEAIGFRNEVAYQQAVKANTYTAFLNFLNRYPQAVRVHEARQKYDQLLYESSTKDKRLSSFENFLRSYPETPFRKEIEQNIFEQATMAGNVSSYSAYLQRYPNTVHAKMAKDILFHMLLEQDEPDWPEYFLTDSLQNVLDLQRSFLIPFFKNGKFGFMDKDGQEVMPATMTELKDEYKCGNITGDVIATADGVLASNGNRIYSGAAEEVDDMGSGFLKLKSGGCFTIVHKSGFRVRECVANAKVLGNRFIGFSVNTKWSLHALSGRKLLAEEFDEISLMENIIVLKKDSGIRLVTVEHLLQAAEEQGPLESALFDEVNLVQHGLLWVRNKKYQGVLNQKLEEVIPFDDHELSPQFFGILGKSFAKYSIYDLTGRQASSFQKVLPHEPWLAVQTDNLWFLMDPVTHKLVSEGYDSLKFEGPFVLGLKEDTLSVHFAPNRLQKFMQPLKATFIPGKDSTSFLIMETENRKAILNMRGKALFSGTFDQIQYAGRDLFIVSKKNKKGLVNLEGKLVLPIEYDAIGSENNRVISLLRSMKFGLYHTETRKLIKPQFDKNLIPYNTSLIIAFRDGLYGLIDWNNKVDGKFEFEEIHDWNDTTALVKQNQLWNLFDIRSKEILESNIREIRMIRNSQDEKLAIVKQGDAFGVLSNKRGVVIPLSFSDLVNLGSADEPFYFTEKHVEEAAIFVVIYYDENGKLLRREVYEEGDDYERIYCSDN